MSTVNTLISSTWTKVAADSDDAFLITWDNPVEVEFAVTAVDAAPTVHGHRLNRQDALTRLVLGNGFVWARTVSGSMPATVGLVVSK